MVIRSRSTRACTAPEARLMPRVVSVTIRLGHTSAGAKEKICVRYTRLNTPVTAVENTLSTRVEISWFI